jgi:RNA polymerase sigma-70 factor (ECF subfamily)
MDEDGGAYADGVASQVLPAVEALEQAQQLDALERAVRRLPDQQRVPLVLFHFEEVSYQEIAGLLGISLAKVKTDIHRGREALRRLLSSDAAF